MHPFGSWRACGPVPSDPLNAVMGSKAFTATVRAILSVIVEGAVHYLCLPKHNLGTAQPSLTFRISGVVVGEDEGRPITAGKIDWTGESRDSAEEIMARKQRGETTRDRAKVWLEKRLSKSPVSSKALKEAAKREGFEERTLRRAADELKVVREGEGKETTWSLPSIG